MMTVTNNQTMVGYDVFRLQNEIGLMENLEKQDPCIVYFQEGFTDGKTNYIIIEYVHQITLLEYIQ